MLPYAGAITRVAVALREGVAMKRLAWGAVLLLTPGLLPAAPPVDRTTTTGLWKVDGEVMGTTVRMMCALTETNRRLSGTCSGEQDGYTPHKIDGGVKAEKMQFYFQTFIRGNPITMSLSGVLNEDRTKLEGNMDVEPMAVGGAFTAVREVEGAMPAATGDATPGRVELPAASDAGGAGSSAAGVSTTGASASGAGTAGISAAGVSAAGTWKIDGSVQGNPVTMSCAIAEAEQKLTGTCSGAGDAVGPQALTGEVTEKGVTWRFGSAYNGMPITFSMTGAIAADGAKMSGSMTVAPWNASGTFVAVKQ
jgi:hypothetical protein